MNTYSVSVKYINGDTIKTTVTAIDGWYAMENIRPIASMAGAIKSISASKVRLPYSK
jgi:hypothetical protein